MTRESRPSPISHWAIALRNNIFAGVAVLLPLILTVAVIRFILDQLDQVLLDPLIEAFRPFVPWLERAYLAAAVKILLVMVILICLALLGLAAKFLIVRRVIHAGESIVARVPFVSNIYSAVQQVSHIFFVKKQNVFQRVVLIEFPRKGCYMVGFITSDARGEIQRKTTEEVVNVFVPTTPNPTSGFLLMLPLSETTPLDMGVEDAMKLIISGGAITPEPGGASRMKRFDSSAGR